MATPPLPKGAVVVSDDLMPPLPKGATVVEEAVEPVPEEKPEPGFIERFKETFQPSKAILEESLLPMLAPPGGYTPAADVRTVFGGKGAPPAAQQIVGSYLEQQRADQERRRAEAEGQPKAPLPGVVDTLKALGSYAVNDPGGFSGQMASALLADPALLMLPEFIPERVMAAIARSTKVGAAAVKTADAASQAAAVAAGESAARQLRETGTIDMEKLRNDARNAAVIGGGIRVASTAVAPGAALMPGSTEATQKLVREAADKGYAVPMEHLSTFGAAIDKYFRRPKTEQNSKIFINEVTAPTGTPVKELSPDTMSTIDRNLSNEVNSVLGNVQVTIPPSFVPMLREFLKYKKGSVQTTLDSIENGIPISGKDWHQIRSLLGQQRSAAYGSNAQLANDLGDILNGWDSVVRPQLRPKTRADFNAWKAKYVAYMDLFDAVKANPTSYNNFLEGTLDPQDLANAIRMRRPKEAVQRRTQRPQTAAASRAAALNLTGAPAPKNLAGAFPLLDPALRSVLAVPAKLSQYYMYSPIGQRTMIGGPGGGITAGRVPRLAGETPALNLSFTDESLMAPPSEEDSGELPAVVPEEIADNQPYVPEDQPEGMADGGLLVRGNIDLSNRPVVKNPDGSVSTVLSRGFNINGQEVLLPLVVNGRVVSDAEAVQHYLDTGEHLGIFDSPEASTAYGKKLHEMEQKRVIKKAVGGAVDDGTDYTQYNERIFRALVAKYGSEEAAREAFRRLDGGELLRIMADYERRNVVKKDNGGLLLPPDRSSNFRAAGEQSDDTLSRFGSTFFSSLPSAAATSLKGSFDLASLVAKYFISPPAQKAQMLSKVPGLAEAVVETAKQEIPKIPARVAAATPEDYGRFAAQYAADTALDPMRLGRTSTIANVVKPKGGTVIPSQIDEYLRSATDRYLERGPLTQDIKNFWQTKARNYFMRNFGSEEDPIRDALFSGRIVKGDASNEMFRDYAIKAARQGDREALQDLMRKYDQATGIRGYSFFNELPEDWVARNNFAQELKQKEISKIPSISVSGRQIRPDEEFINMDINPVNKNEVNEPRKYYSEEVKKLINEDQPENIQRALQSGEPIYQIPVQHWQFEHLMPRQINSYLQTKTAEEIKNMTFDQAVAEASQHFKEEIIKNRVLNQIRNGKNVDRSIYDSNTTPVFNYDNGSSWVKFDNQKAMDVECAHIGHCGMVSGGNEQIDNGKVQIFSLRDSKGHPLTTVELTPIEIFNPNDPWVSQQSGWRVNQLSGEGRKTGNATPNATATQIINLLDSIPDIKQVKYSNAVGSEIPNDVVRWAQEKGVEIIGAPISDEALRELVARNPIQHLAKGGAVQKDCGCKDYTDEEKRLLKRYATG